MVTGAGGTAGRNFIRSLRMSNLKFRVIGTDCNKFHLACSDVDKRILLTSSYNPDYIPNLIHVINENKIDFVHAQPDTEVSKISNFREDISTNLFLPSKEGIKICQNKFDTYRILKAKGIDVPLSYIVEGSDSLPVLISKIQKRTNSKVWVRAIKGAGSRAALPVTSHRQAREWIHYWRSNRQLDSRDFMLSEFLPGKEFAFQSLWYKGKLVTSMARERMEYLFGNLMPSGQSSSPSIAKSVHNSKVNKLAIKAIKSIETTPHGIYCVDVKENRQGVPCVTEINAGRFFTTSDFFSEAGINMPETYVKLGLGLKIPKLKTINAVAKHLYWIRGVDRTPTLLSQKAFDELF